MVIERFEESQARIEVRAYKQEDVRVATGAMAEPEDCRVRCNNPQKQNTGHGHTA